ncbi:MAG: M3 family oligoendopeptidase [Candidatus Hatepunaea meridiana]|nr:M3 family oligoendopeptidase [Candidatus Hatepunaea meridiana]
MPISNDNIINRLSELKRPSPEHPRQFVPDDLDLSEWKNFEPLINNLADRTIDSKEALEQWLIDESELSVVISEERTRRYVAATCATDDKDAERSYLNYISKIIPKIQPLWHKLDQKLMNSDQLYKLDQKRYSILIRHRRTHNELFREESIQLNVEITKLIQQYQKIMGGMTVDFKGNEHTLQRMWVYVYNQDRDLRREAWTAIIKRELQDSEQIDEIFDKLLVLRIQVARNAGYNDFRMYQFRLNNRFDYTPDDCFFFHEAIEKYVVPLARKLQEERRKVLGLDTIRPWDKNCDTGCTKPLKPFQTVKQLVDGCREIFYKVDSELGDWFQKMIDLGLLDLSSRKGKAPGGYQVALSEVRLPFIFMNAVGLNSDLFTLLHEAGHAFHQFAVSHDPIMTYRSAPKEFNEVASMSMELLGSGYIDTFYNVRDAARARRNIFEDMTWKLISVAINDAFQHWIYTHPGHSPDERSDYYVKLIERFGSGVDWSGYEDLQRNAWHVIGQLFRAPFYYIEYGIAQLGALQVWLNSLKDKEEAIEAYKNALSLGGSRSLPELFKTAKTKFDLSEKIIEPMMIEVANEIERQWKMESG